MLLRTASLTCHSWVELVINGEYEAAWSAGQIIVDFQPPYAWDHTLLETLYKRLEQAAQSDTGNKEFIMAVMQKFDAV